MTRKRTTYDRWLENPVKVEAQNKARLDRMIAKHGQAEGRRRYFEWATGGRGVLW